MIMFCLFEPPTYDQRICSRPPLSHAHDRVCLRLFTCVCLFALFCLCSCLLLCSGQLAHVLATSLLMPRVCLDSPVVSLLPTYAHDRVCLLVFVFFFIVSFVFSTLHWACFYFQQLLLPCLFTCSQPPPCSCSQWWRSTGNCRCLHPARYSSQSKFKVDSATNMLN